MLRMGKNPNEEKSPTQTQPSVDNYSQRTYAPYQLLNRKRLRPPRPKGH